MLGLILKVFNVPVIMVVVLLIRKHNNYNCIDKVKYCFKFFICFIKHKLLYKIYIHVHYTILLHKETKSSLRFLTAKSANKGLQSLLVISVPLIC